MTVKAIYRRDPATGTPEHADLKSDGFYRLVDGRIPFALAPGVANARNLARMAVRALSLDEAAALIELGYGIRIRTVSGQSNYVYPPDLIIER